MTQPRDPRRPPSVSTPRRAPEEEDPLDLGLEPDAPLELPMDALVVEDDQQPIALDASALDPYDVAAMDDPFGEAEAATPLAEQVPLMEGFESTGIEERAKRPKRDDRASAKKQKTDFVFTACPGCGTAQPDPAPPYCEACGQRLRKPGKKEDAIASARTKRCIECGFKNREDATNCTNCGMRLK